MDTTDKAPKKVALIKSEKVNFREFLTRFFKFH